MGGADDVVVMGTADSILPPVDVLSGIHDKTAVIDKFSTRIEIVAQALRAGFGRLNIVEMKQVGDVCFIR
jgi:hypothetical protein